MEIRKNKSHKKSWDEEMKELFQQLRQQQAHYPDLKTSHLKPSKLPHVLEPLRLREPRLFRIWDISQKFLFIVNSMLIANPLDFNSPEVWMAVLPNNALDPRQQPIFMGLTDGSHTLSCTSSSKGQPQLHLVMDGSSETCSFESAQFPGWFISTSSEPNKPINLVRGRKKRNLSLRELFKTNAHVRFCGKCRFVKKSENLGNVTEMAGKAEKKIWDEEMRDLFEQFEPECKSGGICIAGEPSPRLFRFWDISQKIFSLMGDDKLVASPNDSNATGEKIVFFLVFLYCFSCDPFPEQLIAVLPNNALDVRKQAIFMGIQPNTVINCVQSEEGQVQLQLMQNEKFLSFSFYSKTDGSRDTCSFESAQFPGWFLSTSSEAHKPIGLSQKGGPENILFHFQRIN
ncbi:hypothetical protein E2320_007030 [Naja naja]|nr:hypothetical protein E2320_007030 [Naja naja]